MAQDTIKKIAEYKSRLADLERDLFGQLADLPSQYGFATSEEFIAAFRNAVASNPGRKAAKAPKAPKAEKAAKPAKAPKAGRKQRVKITPEIIEQVKALIQAGKTGKEIAEATSISLPSVQNLKKKLGMVTPVPAAPAATEPAV